MFKGGTIMSDYTALLAALGIYLIFLLVVVVLVYVLYGISHMKALKALGYDKPWMAWIPFANYWALADVALNGEDSMNLFGSLSIPGIVFKLWWVIYIVVSCIPKVGNLLGMVLTIICLGTCYIKMYARLDGKDEKDVRVVGYLSGWIPLIALCKFLAGKYDAQ